MEREAETLDEWAACARACVICEPHLPHGVRPVLQVHSDARILIAGQAPGRRVHESGVPFDDPSGDRLRDWLGVSRETFYDARRIAILPMGFCYPGTGSSGDLPPRPECAAAWRRPLLAGMPHVALTLVIGRYAMDWHLPERPRTVTEAVAAWRTYGDGVIALPHPSPRNNRWFLRNAWFDAELVPELRRRVREALG